jgi:hypothetical protein
MTSLEEQDHGPHGVVVGIAGKLFDSAGKVLDGLADRHDLAGLNPAARSAFGFQLESAAFYPIDTVDRDLRRPLRAAVVGPEGEILAFGNYVLAGLIRARLLRAWRLPRDGHGQHKGQRENRQPDLVRHRRDSLRISHRPLLLDFECAETLIGEFI